MTDTTTADTGHTDPDLIASLFRRVRRLETDVAVKAAEEAAAKLPPAAPVMKLPPSEPTTWTGAEHAAFDKLTALAAMGVSFDYDPGNRTLRLHNPVKVVDAGHVGSLAQYAAFLAVIFNSGIPATIISGVAKLQSMPGIPAGIKAGCAHLLRASFTPDLLKSWDAVQVFGMAPAGIEGAAPSLAQRLGDTSFVAGWLRTDDRRIVRNTVIVRDKVTGEETTWRRPEPSAYQNHKTAWSVNDATIMLPTPAADDPTLPTP